MTNVRQESTIRQIKTLLESYSFDTNRCSIEFLIYDWLKNYKLEWIYLATIEALYLGRYKVVSIKQILNIWQRLGEPKTHFGGDFERFISRNLPKPLPASNPNILNLNEPKLQQVRPEQQVKSSQNIEPELSNSASQSSSRLITRSQANLLTNVVKQDFHIKKISQPQIYTSPQTHDEFGFIQTTSIFSNHHQQIGNSYLSSADGIKTFSPNPDFSKFFQKLKSFADSQNRSQ